MSSLILNDKQIAQDHYGHIIYIDRSSKLFAKQLDPVGGSSQTQRVMLSISELDRTADLQFPSTDWLFRMPKDVNYTTNLVSLNYQDSYMSEDWPSFTLTNPDTRNSPIPFSDSLLSC